MITLVAWLFFAVGLGLLAFYQVSVRSSLLISFFLLITVTLLVPTWWVVIFWLSWGLCLVGKGVSTLRLRGLTRPVMRWLKKTQPSISAEEAEVIQAGSLWWEVELFSGQPDWKKLLQTKRSLLSADEQAFLAGPVEKLCAMLDTWEISKLNDLPEKVWDFIKQQKFWALDIPKKYGGLEFSAQAHSAVITKIASRSMDAAITVMVPNSLGPATFICCFGTQQQKDYFLPRLATGLETPCFALTSLEAGSDAASISDLGVVCEGSYQDKQVLGIRLNFDKRYITLAPITTLIGLAFQLSDPDHLLGETTELGITCALVPANLPGVSRGERHQPMTLSFMNGPVRGENVFIPLEMVVGGRAGIGRGWFMLMECLAVGRSISLPGLATAVNQFSLRVTSAYARLRKQFKRTIGEFEGVAHSLAMIAGHTYVAEAARIFTASAIDAGSKPAVASAIVKYSLTELARKSVNHAMDIHAGKAIQTGPTNYLAQLYNAVPVSITVEGANLLTRNMIIFGQGLVRCHPFLMKEMGALQKNDEKSFDTLLMQHVGFTLSAVVRTFTYGLTGGKCIDVYGHASLKRYLQQLTRMSAAFVLVTDVALLVLGGKLKFKESLSARFADIVSYFYLASAVIYHYKHSEPTKEDGIFMQWALIFCLEKIGSSFFQILQNFPKPFLGKLLWRLIFPFGNVYHHPNDRLSQKIAKLVQNDHLLRDKLTKCCFVGSENDAVSELESAFQQCGQAEQILKKLSLDHLQSDATLLQVLADLKRQKKIGQDDFSLIKTFLQTRRKVLNVDAFKETRKRYGTTCESSTDAQS